MSIDLEFVRHDTYLEVIVTGTFELEDAKRTFVRILGGCVEHRLPNILIDVRQLVVGKPISIRERFDFTVAAARAAIDYRARGLVVKRTAFLGTSAHIDARRFGETVAANRGVSVHPTIDEADALSWLGVETHETTDPHQQDTPR